ncbi:hypothetical protein U9M48_019946 [Paspalum notatum var. saurae]|uniref:Uncharacterized protein n=1 Tax=Paspalum notatum var. saurae TaxID=547442 RepID=A0AAQ3WR68_PASNO
MHSRRAMAPAPAAAPSPAPTQAMDVEDEGTSGGAMNQNGTVVVKSEAVCTDSGPHVVSPRLVKYEGGDTTECSSSFGDTFSGFGDEADDGEPEVNSGMYAHDNGGGPSKTPRRKKVTDEWKNSVGPIMWRCQWLELRMKELSSQVSKYDRELARIKKEKEIQQAVSKENVSMPESMQIHKDHGNRIMKRRKRNKHEENVDTSLYINKHQILSYYHGKQNKGAETDGLLIDDECGNTVDGSIRGGLDTVTLLDSEDCDDILSSIDEAQSQVHLLQDRLRKARSEGEKLAFSEDNTYVRVARKRQHTQKRSFSYTKSRHTKPQKKKNLNILLKDDDDSALDGRSTLPDRETDAHMEGADGNAEEISGECNNSRDKAVTVDPLFGIDNFKPNGHSGDFFTELSYLQPGRKLIYGAWLGLKSIDDVLIDNKAASEACKEFDNAEHLPSGSSFKGQNISAPAELNISSPVQVGDTCAPQKVDTTCSPVEVDSTSAPAVEQESFLEKSPSNKPVTPGNKQELKPNKRKRCSFFTRRQRKVASQTPAANEETGSTPSAAAKEETGSTPSAAMGPSARKRKSGNEPETENLSSAAEQQETQTESSPSKLRVEKVVLVAVNSRRSQRVRKPKVFDE